MEEQQKELSKILGIDKNSGSAYSTKKEPATWAEIYVEIGKLKERAENPQKETVYLPSTNPMPLYNNDPNLHYHNGSPCRNNPCVWC